MPRIAKAKTFTSRHDEFNLAARTQWAAQNELPRRAALPQALHLCAHHLQRARRRRVLRVAPRAAHLPARGRRHAGVRRRAGPRRRPARRRERLPQERHLPVAQARRRRVPAPRRVLRVPSAGRDARAARGFGRAARGVRHVPLPPAPQRVRGTAARRPLARPAVEAAQYARVPPARRRALGRRRRRAVATGRGRGPLRRAPARRAGPGVVVILYELRG